jgi:hypothetical protein
VLSMAAWRSRVSFILSCMMLKMNTEMPRNMLQLDAKQFQRSRHLPAKDLAFFVGFYWIVSWDLRGQTPYLCETLPQRRRSWEIIPNRFITSMAVGVPQAARRSLGCVLVVRVRS